MPDKDIFDFEFGKRWKKPAREINRGINPAIAAINVTKSLMHYLEELKIISDMRKLYNIVNDYIWYTDFKNKITFFNKLRDFERNSKNRDSSIILTETCKKIFINLEYEMNNSDISQMNLFAVKNFSFKEFVINCCNNILDREFHSKMNSSNETKMDRMWNDIEYKNSYHEALNNYIKQVAVKLEKNPFLTKIHRFKRDKEKHKSTEEILHLPIESI